MATLIDVAIADGHFKTLATALASAKMVGMLKGKGPFTVFAPTDEAFGKLPEGVVDDLLDDIPKLTAILKNHVVLGRVTAADVGELDGKTTRSVNGVDIRVSTRDGMVLNDAVRVTRPDIAASNGVIHVIDTVILPPGSPVN